MIIAVALPIPSFDPFYYLVPSNLQKFAKIGSYALVPLRKNSTVGVITKIYKQLPSDFRQDKAKVKEIISIAKLSYQIDPDYLHFLSWIANYYLCSLGEVIHSAIPKSLMPDIADFITATSSLNQLNYEIPILLEKRKPNLLLASGDCLLFNNWDDLSTKELKSSLIQKLTKFKTSLTGDSFSINQLIDFKIGLISIKNALVRNYLSINIDKNRFIPQKYKFIKTDLVLTKDQTKICDEIFKYIDPNWEKPKLPILIHGVTGSGKTEIYIEATKKVLAQGKSALILLPEIALTPQTLNRFAQYFIGDIIVQHSKISPKQKEINWLITLKSTHSLIIGTRSAIFYPINNLGLVVVDEEHDPSFKQQERPFYHARDLAILLAKRGNALAILGSATPSIESFNNAKQNRYLLLTLKTRPTKVSLPQIELVKLKNTPRHSRLFYLAQVAVDKITETLQNNKQVLIFFNRRGYAPILSCTKCGETVCCNNCSVPLTWHLAAGKFICHHCDYHIKYISFCPHCRATSLKLIGIGTERIEVDLRDCFSNYRVLRMDSDAMAKHIVLSETLLAIKNQKYDIIIGTQMIAKGHDFPNVGLVVVPLADLDMNISDFRASERTFQLLNQVAGRAGRASGTKSVTLIQTYNPNHPAIKGALEQDFELFLAYEFQKRATLQEPPFVKLTIITINDLQEKRAHDTAIKLFNYLANKLKSSHIKLEEPVATAIYQKNNRFNLEIKIKTPPRYPVNDFLKKYLWQNKDRHIIGTSRLLIKIDP
ncbi:MAG: primosomal protein N' [SAR324 cluster bacterium]|nr:primosomal protein N' [SAR324 cluster bacterium]